MKPPNIQAEQLWSHDGELWTVMTPAKMLRLGDGAGPAVKQVLPIELYTCASWQFVEGPTACDCDECKGSNDE